MGGEAGKGDRYRKVDRKKYEANWDGIFGCRDRQAGIVCPGKSQCADRCEECECYKPIGKVNYAEFNRNQPIIKVRKGKGRNAGQDQTRNV